jgi:hypothetical protein
VSSTRPGPSTAGPTLRSRFDGFSHARGAASRWMSRHSGPTGDPEPTTSRSIFCGSTESSPFGDDLSVRLERDIRMINCCRKCPVDTHAHRSEAVLRDPQLPVHRRQTPPPQPRRPSHARRGPTLAARSPISRGSELISYVQRRATSAAPVSTSGRRGHDRCAWPGRVCAPHQGRPGAVGRTAEMRDQVQRSMCPMPHAPAGAQPVAVAV